MDNSEPPSLAERGSFRSLVEARDALIDIQNAAIRFVWATLEKKYHGTIATTEILEQVRLEMRLAEWHRALDDLHTQLAPTPDTDTTLTSLRLLYFVAHIWLSTSLSLKPSAFDPFLAEFQQINHLATTLLSSATTTPTDLVGPLYFTATKCRDPATRQRTLALLAHRCNPADNRSVAAASQLAAAIMQIEDAGAQLAARVTQMQQQQHSPPPPPQQHYQQQYQPAAPAPSPPRASASPHASAAVVPADTAEGRRRRVVARYEAVMRQSEQMSAGMFGSSSGGGSSSGAGDQGAERQEGQEGRQQQGGGGQGQGGRGWRR